MRIKLTKCYTVDIVDENGDIIECKNNLGQCEIATSTVFGDRKEAMREGKALKKWVQKQLEKEKKGKIF